jgi:hypothetical protein
MATVIGQPEFTALPGGTAAAWPLAAHAPDGNCRDRWSRRRKALGLE